MDDIGFEILDNTNIENIVSSYYKNKSEELLNYDFEFYKY